MVNIVGDHATYHRPFDAPLTADTEGLARAVSHWVRTSSSAARVGADGAAAVQAAMTPPGQIATLILPADTAWNEGGEVGAPLPVPARRRLHPTRCAHRTRAAQPRAGDADPVRPSACPKRASWQPHRVAQVTGAKLRTPTQVPRMARGRGRAPVDRIPYVVDNALKVLAGTRHVILVGAKPPTAFFAYPGKPSLTSPPDAVTHVLARPEQDAVAALEGLADELGAPRSARDSRTAADPNSCAESSSPKPSPARSPPCYPRTAIVAEDAVTSGRALFAPTFGAAPHDWLQITGGAIGHGFPCATGAAVACPGRKVVCLEADGAGMYTLQALWTQAREKLDVINVVFANRIYKILHGELLAVGARPGHVSNELFDLARPALDWTKLADGMGVEATRVDTLEGFADAFKAAAGRRGPFLIEFQIQ